MAIPGRRPVLRWKWVVSPPRLAGGSPVAPAGAWPGALAVAVIHALASTRLPDSERPINSSMLCRLRPTQALRQPPMLSVRFGLVRHCHAAFERPCRGPLHLRRGRSKSTISWPLDCPARARTAWSARRAPPVVTPICQKCQNRPPVPRQGRDPTDLRSDGGARWHGRRSPARPAKCQMCQRSAKSKALFSLLLVRFVSSVR